MDSGQEPPPLPAVPGAPPPPTMFGTQGQGKKKPKQKSMQPTFLGTEQSANPSNTGQKTLLGQ